MTQADLIDAAAVCAELGISRPTLSRWARDESVSLTPTIKGAGLRGQYWFTREELDRFKAERAAAEATAAGVA